MADQKRFRFRWPHYLSATLVYLTLLVVWAPASLLAWVLPQLTQQVVKLDHEQGSLWRGHAERAQVKFASGLELQLGQLNWQLKPLDLFVGQLGYRLELSGAGVDATAVLSAGSAGAALRDVHAELPANWLEQLSPDLALWQPGGRLVFETRYLLLGRTGKLEGQASLRWLDAVSGRVRPLLGSYRVDVEGADNRLRLKLTTESGPLFLQGAGQWEPRQGLAFRGTVRPAQEVQAELDGLLSLIGPAQADGSRGLQLGH
jgi:hypothetical protein